MDRGRTETVTSVVLPDCTEGPGAFTRFDDMMKNVLSGAEIGDEGDFELGDFVHVRADCGRCASPVWTSGSSNTLHEALCS